MTPLLEVRDLRVEFDTPDGTVEAVAGVSWRLERGRTLGVVGESGAGKSAMALALMGLTRTGNARASGQVLLDGVDLLGLGERELRRRRGDDIAMIFQDPLSALHPMHRVGRQVVEAIDAHRALPRDAARGRAIELLDLVGIPDARRTFEAYPHELSGGMRQRAMIAMAVANDPRVLVADEATTALDVTVQAQVLELLARLQDQLDTALLLITHDLGVIAETADAVAVMYAGRIVEQATVRTLFERPQHPYTWGLLGSLPRVDQARDAPLIPIGGRPPPLLSPPAGCRFHPRCPYVRDLHRRVDPALEPVAGSDGHAVACLLPQETRERIWAELRAGRRPEEARAAAESEEGAA